MFGKSCDPLHQLTQCNGRLPPLGSSLSWKGKKLTVLTTYCDSNKSLTICLWNTKYFVTRAHSYRLKRQHVSTNLFDLCYVTSPPRWLLDYTLHATIASIHHRLSRRSRSTFPRGSRFVKQFIDMSSRCVSTFQLTDDSRRSLVWRLRNSSLGCFHRDWLICYPMLWLNSSLKYVTL